MKKNSFAIGARVTVGALFLIISVVLVMLSFNPSVFDVNAAAESKLNRASDTAIPKPSVPAGVPNCPPIAFSHNTIVDFSAVSGEPFIDNSPNVGPYANQPYISVPFGFSTTVSLLWKSIDGGRSFIALGTPIVRDAVLGPGGGDTHQDFDAVGRFYYSDLAATCVTTAESDDGGNTFAKINPLACIGPGPLGATDDRQWTGAFGGSSLANPIDPASRGYMTVRNLAVSVGNNFHLNRSRDAGTTWTFAQQIGTVSQSGPLRVDKTKRNIGGINYILAYQLYYQTGTNQTLRLLRIRDNDTGAATVAVDDLLVATPGGVVATVFPNIAIDNAGNLYVTWSDSTQIRMVTSQDRGTTWSAVKVVSGPTPPAGKIMPWIIAGDPGRANVVWYQSTLGTGTSLNNRWDIYMGQTLNAFSATPTFQTTKVSEHTIHFGEICLRGLNCDLPTSPGDRSFLEFPSIALDARGAAVITWNDNTNQSGILPPGDPVAGGPYVMFSKQVRGPSLYASVGNVDAGAGTVTIAQPTAGQVVTTSTLDISGTHTVPPDTFDKDELGDGKFPDHGPVIGSNVPALDIRRVTMTDDADDIIVTMEMADLTTAALAAAPGLSGGDGLLYLTQWDYNKSDADPIDNVQWVAVEIRGGVPVGRTGTLGLVRSATSKKFITYNPSAVNSTQVQVTMTNTAPGTITMRIPRNLVENPVNGDRFHTVTAYAMSERGVLAPVECNPTPPNACEEVFNPSSLPLKVDAAGAFTYIVGGGPQYAGIVQYSVDDPTFADPQEASLNSNNNTWQAQLGPSDLTPGAHTLYVRQLINCLVPSPVAQVSFTVTAAELSKVESRKAHGSGATVFPINLPLIGSPGIECRKGQPANGNHRIVFTFVSPLTSVAGAAVTSGTGSVSSSAIGANPREYIVNLSGVSDAQRIRVTLTGITDSAGRTTTSLAVPMDVLGGDTNADRRVNVGDTNQTRSRSGQLTNLGNFRSDLNLDGRINVGDTNFVRSRSGNSIP